MKKVFSGVFLRSPLFLIPVLGLTIFTLAITLGVHLREQQRQIDQLCQMMVTVVDFQENATKQTGLAAGKKYGFYFADFDRGIAVLEELDPKVPGYAKRNPRWIILSNVNQKTLEYWSKLPLSYGKYREIDR